ncbi:HTH_Tnp_Tc3_2 domain-containing protein [Trichonephila clavipes]|nr:HTH_Tnp_Tc3_2 domain-containing protein [Trichonephila clavipes]
MNYSVEQWHHKSSETLIVSLAVGSQRRRQHKFGSPNFAQGRWIVRSVPLEIGAVDTRRYPRAENRVWSDQEDHEKRGSKDCAASTLDPTVTCSTIRAGVGVAIVPQTIFRHLAEANLKSKSPFRAIPLTPEHRQLRLQWCQARSM